MATSRTPVLRASEVGFRVGGLAILSDLELDVGQGELLGIIGPNGAGKTTLLNLFTGLLSPTVGRIEFDGRDLARVSPAGRARLGLGRTFQTSSLFGSVSVFEHVRLAAQARLGGSMRWWHRPGAKDQAAVNGSAALEAVGLTALSNRLASSLSHGDKRKLELAILLATDARVLLLDEPMAGVNTDDVPALSALISDLHRQGRTVLMVEHHVAVVMGLAERVAVLHHGRLLACGSPDAVMLDAAVQGAYLGTPL